MTLAIAAAMATTGAAGADQQPGMPGMRGMGPGAMQHDDDHMKDMQMFHELLDKRALITRKVVKLTNGIDTLTESDDPAVASLIRTHVASMTARVEEARPIHQRDPLFREVFANAAKIVMKREPTAKGVRVIETSADPYVVKLIQAHADVVDAFVANGRSEMMKNHPVPAREP